MEIWDNAFTFSGEHVCIWVGCLFFDAESFCFLCAQRGWCGFGVRVSFFNAYSAIFYACGFFSYACRYFFNAHGFSFFMRYCGERVIDCNFWGVLVQNLMVGRL